MIRAEQDARVPILALLRGKRSDPTGEGDQIPRLPWRALEKWGDRFPTQAVLNSSLTGIILGNQGAV